MAEDSREAHLSGISTFWSAIRAANEPGGEGAAEAQALLLNRYRDAIYRYVLAIVQDRDLAEEICQEFAVRFLRGDFRNVDASRGRFRDFVKASVCNLIVDAMRRENARQKALHGAALAAAKAVPPEEVLDRTFFERWRAELLHRTWAALRQSRPSGELYFETLRTRVAHPNADSEELARLVNDNLHESFTAEAARQTLHRARVRFAGMLIDEVRVSLSNPSNENIEEELIDLGLLEYCKPLIKRRAERFLSDRD